jgi:hypothetical protein
MPDPIVMVVLMLIGILFYGYAAGLMVQRAQRSQLRELWLLGSGFSALAVMLCGALFVWVLQGQP